MIPPVILLAAFGGAWIYDRALQAFPARAFLLKTVSRAILVWLMVAEGYAYFGIWAKKPETAEAFTAGLTSLAYNLRSVPQDTPKYIVIEASGGTVAQADPWDPAGRIQNIPIVTQTVMFLTNSYLPQQQKEQNIHYVLMQDKASIPAGALTAYVTMP
jgi:hypothetical protein